MSIGLASFFDYMSILINESEFPFAIFTTIFVIVLLDIWLGVSASKIKKEPITSRRGSKSVWKLIVYALFLFAATKVEHFPAVEGSDFMLGLIDWIKLAIFSLAFLWEMKSLGESLTVIYDEKPRWLIFLERVSSAFEFLLVKKIRRAGDDFTTFKEGYEHDGKLPKDEDDNEPII